MRGAQEAGAPWREPAKLPSLNLKGLGGLGRSMDAFAGDFKVLPIYRGICSPCLSRSVDVLAAVQDFQALATFWRSNTWKGPW